MGAAHQHDPSLRRAENVDSFTSNVPTNSNTYNTQDDNDDDNASIRTAIRDRSPPLRLLEPAPIAEDQHGRSARDSDSFSDEDDPLPAPSPSADEKPITWSSLPNKSQLAILTVARLSEPLTQTSLQAYMFYQLRSFDPSLPESAISTQAGILQGSFTAAQFLTAVVWGRLADSEWVGRKRVLLIGLLGTCISTIGFGFSRSFVAAAVFRTLGGALNSNVGVMRTMISEIIAEKK